MLKLPAGLWDHQREAIKTADKYLRSKHQDGRAALITMPTGTGKTGVIAAVVTLLPLAGHRLVLTPWEPLVRQLVDDLSGRFWTRLPGSQRPTLPPVRRLPSSSRLQDIERVSEPTVFVATIAAISVVVRRAPELGFDARNVFSGFDCVIVDEGHYEPAHKWSRAIRSLKRPTILLTATPYRNDQKYFNIEEEEARYRFPHHEAEKQRFLRIPEFQTIEAADPESFATAVVGFMNERFGTGSDVRAIIRCSDSDSIGAIVSALGSIGEESVIGLHERFPSQDGPLRREVPSESFNARYWVHQYKLIEGIDDPRFKLLAFFDSLRNDRAIVQQIGRVLRNPQRDAADMTAYVLGRGDRDLLRTWNAYRTFDRQTEAESVATVPVLVDRLLTAQPEAFYYDGGYRTRLNLHDENAWREFAFPLRTRIYRARTKTPPSLQAIEEAVADEWKEIDRSVFTTQTPDATTVIVPYVTAENSPLLRSGTFIEPEFGYTLIRRSNNLLFIFDAQGRTPRVLSDQYRPLQPDILQSLLPHGPSSLTSVSLLNTDIGRQAARSRHIRAAAIDGLAPELADYAYVCSIAEGYTQLEDQRFRRYVGLSRSRVTDYRASERDYETYSSWLRSLEAQIMGAADGASTFDRYAKVIPTPTDPSPIHVLLDIDAHAFEQRDAKGRTPLELEDTALEVLNGKFSIVANGQRHAATLCWDESKGRYVLESPTLRNELFVEADGERELLSIINEEQALRIVPATRTVIYSREHFFQPTLPSRRARGFQLLDILHPVAELANAASEKGDALSDDDWQADCVFGLITALDPVSPRQAPDALSSHLEHPDFLLCSDLGTEMADFIATRGKRVVLMHAKASKERRRCSASVLHDVASQAIKNLPYLQPLSETRPPTGRWTQPWRFKRGGEGTRRLRVGDFANASQMWSHIRGVVSNPSSDREVWIVLGQAMSKSALVDQSRSLKPAPEALQVYSLLQTTWGAVSQLGARLRIFCSP